MIANNNGSAGWGGVSNSVINRGRISGTVAIVGNQSRSGLGRTVGSVEVKRTASVWGAAGVTGNHAWHLNGVGKRRVSPVVSRSVIAGTAVNRVYQ